VAEDDSVAVNIYNQGGAFCFGLEKLKQKGIPITLPIEMFSKDREGWYGWVGFGGSVTMWHLEHKIGFSYTPAEHVMTDNACHRGKHLQKVLVECIKRKDTTNGRTFNTLESGHLTTDKLNPQRDDTFTKV